MSNETITPIINKVEASGLVSIDLAELIGNPDWSEFDMRAFLFNEFILREKDFREALKNFDWSLYKQKHVYVHCSNDAIVPKWAYMLVATNLQHQAMWYGFGNKESCTQQWIYYIINNIDSEQYYQKKVVVKGCSDKVEISEQAYLEITKKLLPQVQSIMYGEPCSTVPVFKKKNSQ